MTVQQSKKQGQGKLEDSSVVIDEAKLKQKVNSTPIEEVSEYNI